MLKKKLKNFHIVHFIEYCTVNQADRFDHFGMDSNSFPVKV